MPFDAEPEDGGGDGDPLCPLCWSPMTPVVIPVRPVFHIRSAEDPEPEPDPKQETKIHWFCWDCARRQFNCRCTFS